MASTGHLKPECQGPRDRYRALPRTHTCHDLPRAVTHARHSITPSQGRYTTCTLFFEAGREPWWPGSHVHRISQRRPDSSGSIVRFPRPACRAAAAGQGRVAGTHYCPAQKLRRCQRERPGLLCQTSLLSGTNHGSWSLPQAPSCHHPLGSTTSLVATLGTKLLTHGPSRDTHSDHIQTTALASLASCPPSDGSHPPVLKPSGHPPWGSQEASPEPAPSSSQTMS